MITDAEISHIIELAWDDQTSFDVIKQETGLSEKDVIKVMQQSLRPRSFELWRRRVRGRKSKHLKLTAAYQRQNRPEN